MIANTQQTRSEFLSEEDMDLRNLGWEELVTVWNQWLRQAQSTNEEDRDSYEHGVFMAVPSGSHKVGRGGPAAPTSPSSAGG